MIAEILMCALALPAFNFTRPAIVSYHMTEEDRLREWLRKNNPDCEVFIHPTPQEELLKKNHFEKVPFTWRGNSIWIRKKPVSDKRTGQSA